MPKVKLFKSQIFNTGSRFVVNPRTKDGSFGPGTTGFVSFAKGRDMDYMNVVFLNVIVTKRGKTGKERLGTAEISTPVFDIDHESVISNLPDEKRRAYIHIDPITANSITEMSNIDFLAWAMAQCKYVYKLNTRAKHINTWPNDNNDILNRYLHMDEYYGEDPDYTKDQYASHEARVIFVKRIRIMESTLVKCALSYMTKVAELEETAIRDLLLRGVKIDGKVEMIAKTQEAFANKKKSLAALEKVHGKKAKKKGSSKLKTWL